MIIIALIALKWITDFILLNVYSDKLRKEYNKVKFINSDDFTDLKEGLDPVKKERF